MGLNKALQSFNVLRSILKDYAEKVNMMPKKMELGYLGRMPVLPAQLESSA